MMKDSVNILLRTAVRPKGLTLENARGEGDWTVRLILDYLPTMARAVRLEGVSISPAAAGDEADFWVHLPQETSRDALLTFLRWFVGAAIDAGFVASQATNDVGVDVVRTADDVASSWTTIGF